MAHVYFHCSSSREVRVDESGVAVSDLAEARDYAARVVRFATLPAPGGMTLVVKPLRGDVIPDPIHLDSWALTLGDLEVF